jgi:AMMECR1 domain-containing protein
VYDWEVGKHGIIIDIEDVYNATFLPEVAKEQGWDQKQTMRALVRKAGWSGTLEEAEKVIKLTTYESSKEYMSYEEFVKGDWKN